jgi:hypothetical protein
LKKKENYTEEDERAIRNLATAMDNLRKSVGGKPGESAEAKYAEAYNLCYRLGLKQYKLKICRSTR